MLTLYKHVRSILTNNGHQVVDYNSSVYSENDELLEGVNKTNDAKVQLFISFHMNSYNKNAHGTEAWTYSPNSSANQYAKALINNYVRLEFYNRGLKHSTEFYELKNTYAPSIVFEACFALVKRIYLY